VFTDALKAFAHKELSDKLKSRWVLVIASGFALFTVVIAYFGAAPAGIAGFKGINPTIASLTSLVTYFIPILALTLGGGIIADEREKGTLDIFLSSPISFRELILGKFAGLSLAFILSSLSGFGIAGIILFIKIGMSAIGNYLLFIIHSVLLGIIFLSLSFMVSIFFYERTRVIAFTIFIWLFFTVLYDLALIGLIIITQGAIGTGIFSILLMLNPVDVYRLLNFLSIGELSVIIGLTTVELPAYIKTPVLWAISILWISLPLALSHYLFKRKYLK